MRYRGPDGHCLGHLYIYIYIFFYKIKKSVNFCRCTRRHIIEDSVLFIRFLRLLVYERYSFRHKMLFVLRWDELNRRKATPRVVRGRLVAVHVIPAVCCWVTRANGTLLSCMAYVASAGNWFRAVRTWNCLSVDYLTALWVAQRLECGMIALAGRIRSIEKKISDLIGNRSRDLQTRQRRNAIL
jgi:hypothetical protein